jgi:hypothetical protein
LSRKNLPSWSESILEFKNHPLGTLATNPRDFGQGNEILGCHRMSNLIWGHGGQDGQSKPWSDPTDGLQNVEDLPLIIIGKSVQRQGILAHDHPRGNCGLRANPERTQGGWGALQIDTYSADVDNHRGRGDRRHLAPHE